MLSSARQLAVAALLVSGVAAQASTTLSFQQGLAGYAGTQDAMVRSNETATGAGQSSSGDSRGRNFGALDFLSVDGDDGSPGLKPNQGLIRFDNLFGAGPGQIRAGDTILKATLQLVAFDPGSGLSVHDLLMDWSQNSVTWNSLGNGVQVGTEAGAALQGIGADSSSANVAAGVLSFDVTASLQAMQAGQLPGFGWLLNPFTNGTNGIDLRSSEYATHSERPLLIVEVSAVPEPGSWALMALGLAGVVALRANRRSA